VLEYLSIDFGFDFAWWTSGPLPVVYMQTLKSREVEVFAKWEGKDLKGFVINDDRYVSRLNVGSPGANASNGSTVTAIQVYVCPFAIVNQITWGSSHPIVLSFNPLNVAIHIRDIEPQISSVFEAKGYGKWLPLFCFFLRRDAHLWS
jgi:hypothetical protein